MADSRQQTTWQLDLPDETATANLASEIALILGAGDLVTLSGDLGSGKTSFARALIRHLTEDETLEVPSPTFTLMQVYPTPSFPIVHADLYRIKSPDELVELGWDEAADGALLLVEWADRAGTQLPDDRLDVFLQLTPGSNDARGVLLTGTGSFAARLNRARSIHEILQGSGWSDAHRSYMLGDASSRAYERLAKPDGSRAILMISPPRPDGPPIRYGRPYSSIAKLAEDIRAFVHVDMGLRAQGFSAPELYAYDLQNGLAVLEDLGSDGVVDDAGPIPERYAEAAAVLADLHGRDLPPVLNLAGDADYRIPPYDLEALLIEVELLLDWYVPFRGADGMASGARVQFTNLWRQAIEPLMSEPQTWALRDYHSPNLIWLPERESLQRVGIIDFQDCVMGHAAYDVASLLQDARVDVPDDLELRLLSHYARKRRERQPDFDMAGFARAYAVLGAQRATKILGIFVRLQKRDGKPQYLAHLPRIENYLAKDLAHPALDDLRGWFATYLPHLTGTA
ncbi:MAG: tRNA ((37)-N6)-threonylcarbamoyltransferase complex ATPase subunit type 1 TsaE [Frankiales bacterium]|nr:tRNA ((37)-N6)-threonylcarbamoyltransferase complex ATPase subunit type 1 TsaE [Frankiales bacterium]